MDLRLKNLSLDLALLAANTGLTRLDIHVDIPIGAGDFKLLERLVNLEETLPKTLGGMSASSVRVSASKKLTGIEPLCESPCVEQLTLQALPALRVRKEVNKLEALKELHVEMCGWTDFSQLEIAALRKLFVSEVDSLRFIEQLDHLEDLFFWHCRDGDLTPVLRHPTLTRIRFVPAKKHYSHELADLQRGLSAKNLDKE